MDSFFYIHSSIFPQFLTFCKYFLPFHDRKYFGEKESYKSHHYKEDNLATGIKKYRGDSEKSCEKVDNISNAWLWKSELEEPIVQVMGLISFHRILSCEDPRTDYIDEVDEVDAENRHRGRYLPSGDNREGRDEECQDNRPWVTHNPRTPYIHTGYEVGNRDEYREKYEDKLAIFSRGDRRIGCVEFDREKSDDEKTDQGKSSCQAWYAVRKINTIKY